jgi:hypothetical protein
MTRRAAQMSSRSLESLHLAQIIRRAPWFAMYHPRAPSSAIVMKERRP